MPLPKYNELYIPILTVLSDEKTHTLQEIKEKISVMLQLTDEDLSQRLVSGKQSVYDNRLGWARTSLKKAGLIDVPQRGEIQITKEGKSLLVQGMPITNQYLIKTYPSFAEFMGRKTKEPETQEPNTSETTPHEMLENIYHNIQEQLADDLLTEIVNHSPAFFEELVVNLMRAMDYGEGFVTKSSHDDGIDGVIHEDKLGFNLIYIQAKRWTPNTTIGKPEIQKFAGAMMGPPKIEKGLFITTAKFSQGAKQFADAQHIILIDGKRLTELMIEYNLGVSVQKTYEIKRIDMDYFIEN